MHIARLVLPSEYRKYRTHLLALDDESRYLRFASSFNDSAINSLCDKFESSPELHILFAVENADLAFIGMGHIALGGTMELAFSVLPSYQRQGIGNKLMTRVIQYCRTHGHLSGHMVCVPRNIAIKQLCINHKILLQSEFGETTGTVSLDSADASTYIAEAASASFATIDYLSKRALCPWTILF